jgi:predicted MFS family arabinose efflux permease
VGFAARPGVPRTLSERRLIALLGSVQFVNVLDFMMVLPLGPDFARALAIPTSQLGLVGTSYTAAAALSGILGAVVLDRFDRRRALGAVLGGLAVGTAAGAFATSLGAMLAARVLAGAFGGPATSLSLAIVSDAVPVERRGRAMGALMGGFAAASVLGVPAGLQLAQLGGWRSPFLAVAALGASLAAIALRVLPALDARSQVSREPSTARAVLRQRPVVLALVATAAIMTAQFAVVSNIAAYWQFNLGYPRERLGLLFVAGGLVSFVGMRLAGRLVDRAGAALTAAAATALYVAVLLAGFVFPTREPHALALFVGFMAASSFRMVPVQSLSSLVPAPGEPRGSCPRSRSSSTSAPLSGRSWPRGCSGSFLGAGSVGWTSWRPQPRCWRQRCPSCCGRWNCGCAGKQTRNHERYSLVICWKGAI